MKYPNDSTYTDEDGNICIQKELLLTCDDGAKVVGVYIGEEGIYDSNGNEMPMGFYWTHPVSADFYPIDNVISYEYIKESL